MGRNWEERRSCQRCHRTGEDVEERGRAVPLGWLCDEHWTQAVQTAAVGDDSVWRPADDPDDLAFREPQPCPDCGTPLTLFTTNFGRSIALEACDVPAKTVPARFRWCLHTTTGRNSRYVIMVTAVHLGGIEPLPDEPVRPAHRATCPAPAARDDVHDEHLRDLERARRRLGRPEQDTAG